MQTVSKCETIMDRDLGLQLRGTLGFAYLHPQRGMQLKREDTAMAMLSALRGGKAEAPKDAVQVFN